MKHIILALLSISAVQAFGQKQLPSEKVDVISNFEATIKDQNMVEVKPVLTDDATKKPVLKYDVSQKPLGNIVYDAPKIRPLAMKTEKGPKAYNGFAKLGYGYPSSLYANAGYNYIGEKYKIGADIFHHDANNSSNVPNQKFGLTSFNIGGGINTELDFAVDAGLKIEDRRFNFYSVDTLPIGVDPLRQFSIAGFKAKAYNTKETSWGINYDVGFDYNNLKSNYGVKENDFDIKIGLTKWFTENIPLKLVVGNDITSLTDSNKTSLNNFYFKPSLSFTGESYNIKLGTNITGSDGGFSVYPDLEAMVRISGNTLAMYAGWTGDVQKNTYQRIMLQNPFVVQHHSLNNSKFNKFYGGIRGKVGVVSYQGEAGFKTVKNMLLFINDSVKAYGFGLVYDNIDIFNVNGTLIFDVAKGLSFTANAGYNIYTTDQQKEAWHLPSLEANFGAVLMALNDKMRIKAELYVADAGKYKVYESQKSESLNMLLDLSFEVAYRFSEKFGAFLQLNNLPNNKYQRWYNTPTYGLNVLGGLTARF